MYEVVIKIAAESGTKLKMIICARAFYSVSDLMCLYKCYVLAFVESGTPTYYYATISIFNSMITSKMDLFFGYN